MRLSVFALLSASLASLAAAYTQPVGDTPSGNPTIHPAAGEIVPGGAPYTISWTPTTQGTITILLLRGPSTNVVPLYSIVENIPNTGSYSWTPSTSLQADTTHYGIELIVDATGQFQYSPQFGISQSGSSNTTYPVSSNTTSYSSYPTANATYSYYSKNTTNSTTYAYASSTGGVPTTIIQPTASLTVPVTLQTTAKPTASAPAATGAAGRVVLNLGAAAVGVGAAVMFI